MDPAPVTYVIANWQSRFETAETRKLEHLRWCPSPNKLDGLGYKRMVQQRDRSDLFAAWNVMRAIASKTTPKEKRGRLERDGRPLSADDMALMSGFPTTIFDRALTFFSSAEIGWLERELSTTAAEPGLVSGQSPARPADSPAPPAEPPAEGIEGKEGKERREDGAIKSRSAPVTDEEWKRGLMTDIAYKHINILAEFSKWQRWCTRKRKKPTQARFEAWLNNIEPPVTAFAGVRTVKSPKVLPDPPEQMSEERRLANLERISKITEGLRTGMSA